MKRYPIVLIVVLLLVAGCQSNPGYTDSSGFEAVPAKESMQDAGGEELLSVPDRKLIKEGNVEFETTDLAATRERIREALAKHKGYISADNEYKSPGRITHTLTVRVPSAAFDIFLTEATEGVSHFDQKHINVQDVTEEYLDVEARIKTKKELEARYLDLLKLAKSVPEMMEIERQLSDLRSQIESIEGRLKYLDKSVNYSTLIMTFYEQVPKSIAFGQKFKHGFRNGWDNLIWFMIGLVNIWPFVVLGGLLWWVLRRYIRKKKSA